MRSVCVKLALIIAKIEMDSSVSALQKYICPFFWGVQLTNAMPEFIHFIFGLPHLFSLQLKIVCVCYVLANIALEVTISAIINHGLPRQMQQRCHSIISNTFRVVIIIGAREKEQ